MFGRKAREIKTLQDVNRCNVGEITILRCKLEVAEKSFDDLYKDYAELLKLHDSLLDEYEKCSIELTEEKERADAAESVPDVKTPAKKAVAKKPVKKVAKKTTKKK